MSAAPDVALRRAAVAAVLVAALPLLLTLPGAVMAGLAGVGVVAAASALRRPLPAALRLLLVLLITAAVLVGFGFRVGRDAGSALMLAMLLLKLAELRDLDDVRRVTGFALFAPFAAFLQDQGPTTLVLGLVATVAVLVALARVARAPLPAPTWREEARGLGRSLLLALPLALVGFWLFPRLPAPLWGLPENALAKTGISESMSPGDWIDLMADDRPAFRVRFDGPTPPSETLYWRGPVLSRFDGRMWTRGEWIPELPRPAWPRRAEGGITYTLTLEPTERRYVFALEAPSAWPETLSLGTDATLRHREPLRALARFTLEAQPIQGYQADLPLALRAANLSLPSGFNPRTRERALALRREARDERDYIRRVLAWFNAEHAYSIAAPPLGRHTADEFLFDTRVGFCEHFSSAFVILMRSAGIPARVVTGYTGGVPNRVGGYWVVRQMDAHAWSEVWLEGQGWVRIDPTAAVAPERIYDTLDDFAGEGFGGAMRPVLDFGDSLREAWNSFVVAYDAARQVQLLQALGWREAGAVQVGQAFVIAAGLVLGLTLLVLLRLRPIERDPLSRAWRVFLRRWAKHGLAKATDEPATGFLIRLRETAPADAEAIALVERFIALRYAAQADDAPPDAASRENEREALSRALRRHRPGPLRRR